MSEIGEIRPFRADHMEADHDAVRRHILRRRTSRMAMSLLAVTSLYTVADNVAHYATDFSTMDESGPMVEDVAGCPTLPTTEPQADAGDTDAKLTRFRVSSTKKVEALYTGQRSAAENFTPKKFNVLATTREWLTILQHEYTRFTSSYSGIDFHIYSDEDSPFSQFDTNQIDELLHASLSEEVSYDHVGTSSLMSCLRNRFIDPQGPRELAGERVNIYIPSDAGVCWSNGRVQEKPETIAYKDFCDSTGATLADIRFAMGPFEYEQSWMVLMTADKNTDTYKKRLAEMLIHESSHLWTQKGGLAFRLDRDEGLAKYLTEKTITDLYPNGVPEPIEYLATETSG